MGGLCGVGQDKEGSILLCALTALLSDAGEEEKLISCLKEKLRPLLPEAPVPGVVAVVREEEESHMYSPAALLIEQLSKMMARNAAALSFLLRQLEV